MHLLRVKGQTKQGDSSSNINTISLTFINEKSYFVEEEFNSVFGRNEFFLHGHVDDEIMVVGVGTQPHLYLLWGGLGH